MRLQGIDVEVVRRGKGQPLLLLHGGGGPVGKLPFIEQLAQHFDVIAPTHPGFGGSTIPDHFDRIDDLVFLYLDLLEELALRDVILLGFSMGGWTAAELAAGVRASNEWDYRVRCAHPAEIKRTNGAREYVRRNTGSSVRANKRVMGILGRFRSYVDHGSRWISVRRRCG